MTEFDELSRGDQFLLLRNRDYEILIKVLRTEITNLNYLMKHYPESYSSLDIKRIISEIEMMKKDIEFYSQFITDKGGAENEEFLTESRTDSESPSDQYKGPTCTTV